jgi:HAMP domain-containing protein
MKLTLKWIVWFVGIGVYVMCLGGVFYYNLFKWTFDERLKTESITMVRNWAPLLQKGLAQSPWVVTLDEMDIMNALNKDDRVANLLYLNKNGSIRWFKDTEMWSKTFDEYIAKYGDLKTGAIKQAYVTRAPKVAPMPGEPYYEVAIPLSKQKGGGAAEVMGVIDLMISREGVEKVIRSAMNKYILGAIGVLLLIGGPLYFFMHHFILAPLQFLRDALESVTVRNLDLKFPVRKDEIGEVANAFSGLLVKLKAELDSHTAREQERGAAEEKWWENILKVVVGQSSQAIVMDEDNTVLYTNFNLNKAAEPGHKMHLLDVVDTQQQELLRLVGQALEQPNDLLQGETVFRGEPCQVRVMHLAGLGQHRRTLIMFEPKRGAVLGGSVGGGFGA